MYYSDADKLRAALELLFLLVVAFFVLVEVCEIVEAARDGAAGLAEYCGSMTNVLDIATYVALTTAVSMWCSVYFGDALDELRPETLSPRVGDVAAEFFATGEGAGLVEMGAAGQARYEAFFGAITSVVEALNEYQTVVSVALMLTLGQLIGSSASARSSASSRAPSTRRKSSCSSSSRSSSSSPSSSRCSRTCSSAGTSPTSTTR